MPTRTLVAVVSIVALLAVVALDRPANPAPQIKSLAGDLLVASPEMRDPRFARTVIYLIRHDAAGAQGFVVNRPLGEIALAKLLEQMQMDASSASGQIRLHGGGPVDSRRIFVLHTSDYNGTSTTQVKNGVSVTSEPEILEVRRRRQRAAPAAPHRRLCGLGARPARSRDGGGRLDPRGLRRGPALRRGLRQEVGEGPDAPEDRSVGRRSSVRAP